MNAGTVKCRCGVHYSARDPHPVCRTCADGHCSRSQPCDFCRPLSSTEWDLWLDQEAKTSAYSSKRVSVGSCSPPATESLDLPQDTNVHKISFVTPTLNIDLLQGISNMIHPDCSICLSYKYCLVVMFALRHYRRATLTRFNLGLN